MRLGLWIAAMVLWVCAAGCTATQEVTLTRFRLTDLSNGKSYTTIGRDINRTGGGVTFRDESSGERVTISNYTEQQIEDGRYRVRYNAMNGQWESVERIN